MEIKTAFKFILFILSIGLLGWFSYFVFVSGRVAAPERKLKEYTLLFLSGFAALSVFSLVLASLGWFRFSSLIASSIVPGILYFFLGQPKKSAAKKFLKRGYVVFCVILAVASVSLAGLSRPYEAIICGYDASIYTASAFQLSRTGGLEYRDTLVKEMTPDEQNIFLDEGGQGHLRFPGGVHISDIRKNLVDFGFFPLFSVWLGLGVTVLGAGGFLYVLSLFSVLGLLILFLIGQELQGLLVGLSIPIVFFFFYPQYYFSHMPMSEILAQTLFLAGLWIFLSREEGQNVISHGQQRLTAILWGALFLCKIDVMLFTVLSLILLFTVSARYWERLYDWRVLVRWLMSSLLFVFYWQLSTGSYLSIRTLNNDVIFDYLWLPVGSYLHDFMSAHPVAGTAIFVLLACAILVVIQFILRRPARKHSLGHLLFGIGFTLTIVLSLIARKMNMDDFLRNVDRIMFYIPEEVLIILLIGIISFVVFRKNDERVIVLLPLFLVPTFSYLFRPFVAGDQPLWIRRFVPVSFPLLFLMGFAGISGMLKQALGRFRFSPYPAFILFVLLLTASFFMKTRYLIEKPLFSNVMEQVQKLGAKLPADSLVVVPRLDEGMYMEMPLQYMLERETISLSFSPLQSNTSNLYLERQMKKRPVTVLSLRATDSASAFLENFRLSPKFTTRLHFSIVPPSRKFPDQSIAANLDYAAYSLEMKRPPVVRSEIEFDDAEVSFMSFHSPEQNLRWTKQNSEIADFIYDTKGEPVVLIVSLAVLPPDDLARSFRLLINQRVKAVFQKMVGHELWFRIEDPTITKIDRVKFISKTFIPKQIGINEDPRELGVAFVRLRLIPAGLTP